MIFMNSFVEREASNMKNFLKKISVSILYFCILVLHDYHFPFKIPLFFFFFFFFLNLEIFLSGFFNFSIQYILI